MIAAALCLPCGVRAQAADRARPVPISPAPIQPALAIPTLNLGLSPLTQTPALPALSILPPAPALLPALAQPAVPSLLAPASAAAPELRPAAEPAPDVTPAVRPPDADRRSEKLLQDMTRGPSVPAAAEAEVSRLGALFDAAAPRPELELPAQFERAWAAKLRTESIFDPEFVREERRQPKTVVFDLDETIATEEGAGPGRAEYLLRNNIESQIDKLSKQGLRIVLWSAAASHRIENFFRKHPRMLGYFDKILPGDCWLLPAALGEADPGFNSVYQDADPKKLARFYAAENPKDISLFRDPATGRGHALLVDDNPSLAEVADSAPFGAFPVYRIAKFSSAGDPEPVTKLAGRIRSLLRRSR